MRKRYLILSSIFILGVCNSSQASVITETSASNSSIGTAQNIDPYFTLGENPDIANATTNPWVSIENYGDEEIDFYSFTVSADATGMFDIDYGDQTPGATTALSTDMDSYLTLYDSSGTAIASNNSSQTWFGAAGSNTTSDANFGYYFELSGMYYISVRNARGDSATADQTYTLQVSINSHPTTPTPEPATMLLFGTGIAGLIGARARRKREG